MKRYDVGRVLAVTALAVLGPVALAAPASAHVELRSSTTTAGESAVLELGFEHGCDGSPTTALAVRLPDGVTDVVPGDDPQWVSEQADGVVTFRAASAIPDGRSATVSLSLTLPATAGTLAFPTIQSCEAGELAWLEGPDGVDADALEFPAPSLEVTADTTPAESGSSAGLAVGVVGAGLLGTAVVGGVVARQRRRA